jgi:hypothetical protein
MNQAAADPSDPRADGRLAPRREDLYTGIHKALRALLRAGTD